MYTMSFHPAVLPCFPLKRNVHSWETDWREFSAVITVTGLDKDDVLNFCFVDKSNFTVDLLLIYHLLSTL